MQTEISTPRELVNLDVLARDLRAAFPGLCAGAKHDGLTVTIIFDDTPTAEQIVTARALVEAHDPATKSAEQLKAEGVKTRFEEARANMKKVPAWATMTEAEAVAFIQSNVTDLASAKQVLVAMARIIVYLRDAQWPDLGEE